MKLLVLSPGIYSLPPSGYAGLERVVSQVCREIGKNGEFEVTIGAPEGSEVENCEVIETVEPENSWDMHRDIEILDLIHEKEDINNFDLVWDNTHSLASYSGKQILRVDDFPKRCATIHNHHSSYSYLPPEDKDPNWIFISEHQKRNMENRLGFKSNYQIYNPVDITEFEFRDGGDYYLFLSRIMKQKGCHIIPKLAKKFSSEEFIMAGDTELVDDQEYVKKIKQLVSQLDNLSLEENVSAKRKVELYRDAKGYLLPDLWCITENQTVMTREGLEKIKNVEKGEEVLNEDGEYSTIKNVLSKKYDDEIVRIRPRYSDWIEVSPNHMVKTFDGWKKAKDVTKSDYIQTSHLNEEKTTINELDIEELIDFDYEIEDGKIQKYSYCNEITGRRKYGEPISKRVEIDKLFLELCALYITEGHATMDGIVLSIGSKEFNDIFQGIEEKFGFSSVATKDFDSWKRVSIYSRPFAKIFKEWFGNGAGNKNFPNWVFSLSRDNKEFFLDKLIHYDGHIEKETEHKKYTSKSKKLVHDMDLLAKQLDRIVTIRQEKMHGHYVCRISPKLRYSKEKNGNLYYGVYDIERKEYEGKVYDLDLDSPDSYIVNNVVVHNSEPMGICPVEAMASGTPVLLSDRGALPELVRDGMTGFSVPIEEYIGEFDLLDTISGEYCRKVARENFDVEVIAEEYKKAFRDIVEP